MKYYLDTEFDGFGGPLLSIGLTSEDGQREFYGHLCINDVEVADPWVRQNVMPQIRDLPISPNVVFCGTSIPALLARALRDYLAIDDAPTIVVDWPDDAAYFARALMTGPGMMVDMDRFTIEFVRCRKWSTADTSEVPHHALYDARALRDHLTARG